MIGIIMLISTFGFALLTCWFFRSLYRLIKRMTNEDFVPGDNRRLFGWAIALTVLAYLVPYLKTV